MTTGGWIIMLASVSFVTGLLIWCVYRVLTTPGADEHVHATTQIDPHDQDA